MVTRKMEYSGETPLTKEIVEIFKNIKVKLGGYICVGIDDIKYWIKQHLVANCEFKQVNSWRQMTPFWALNMSPYAI